MFKHQHQAAVTQPHEVDADRLVLDDIDTISETRPLPEPDPAELRRMRPESLPTIGRIGRYELKYVIGEGGLGTVYAAHDTLLSRLIAIKMLNVHLPQAERSRFNDLVLHEARAAAGLSHSHIVTVHDAGTSEHGSYIAMELLRGRDLRHLLSMGWKPTPEQAALIVRRVADALSYAHHRGVIHRDIKPANIFMVGRTQPRVLDFGIARIRQVEGLATRDDEASRFQELVGGSPFYMAPELVRREPGDRRVDVYALGVVLYELLAGRRAFTGGTLDEIADAVLHQEVRPVHEVNDAIPRELSDIVAQAMHRDLDKRTRSARRLSQALRDWLESVEQRGATGPRGGTRQRVPRGGRSAWSVTLRWAVVLGTLGLMAGAAAWTWLRLHAG